MRDLEAAKASDYPSANFYFTKESHMYVRPFDPELLFSSLVPACELKKADRAAPPVSDSHTLVNLVTLSDLPIVMPHVPELDYMSYVSCVRSSPYL